MTTYTNKPKRLDDGSVDPEFYDYDYWERGNESLKGSYNTYICTDDQCCYYANDVWTRWGPFESYLELGCARGWTLLGFLLSDGLYPGLERVAGVDISRYAVETADARVRGNLYLQDAVDLSSFRDGEFDLILSSDLLEHLTEVQIYGCLLECRRVARKRVVHLVSVGKNVDVPDGVIPDEQDQSHVTMKSDSWWDVRFANVFKDGWRFSKIIRSSTVEYDCQKV